MYYLQPVKPPRMKSFRGSKDSPPEIRVTPAGTEPAAAPPVAGTVVAPVLAPPPPPSTAANSDQQDIEAGGDAETSLLGKTGSPTTTAKEDAVKVGFCCSASPVYYAEETRI